MSGGSVVLTSMSVDAVEAVPAREMVTNAPVGVAVGANEIAIARVSVPTALVNFEEALPALAKLWPLPGMIFQGDWGVQPPMHQPVVS
jgi:hypothetical protein